MRGNRHAKLKYFSNKKCLADKLSIFYLKRKVCDSPDVILAPKNAFLTFLLEVWQTGKHNKHYLNKNKKIPTNSYDLHVYIRAEGDFCISKQISNSDDGA